MLRKEKPTESDFRILGLQPEAAPVDVKRAYRDLVKRWHPDQFQQREIAEQLRAEEKLKLITSAYRRIAGTWHLEEKRKGSPSDGKRRESAREAQARSATKARGDSAARSENSKRPPLRPLRPLQKGLVESAGQWLSAHPLLCRSAALSLALFIIAFALNSFGPPGWLPWTDLRPPERGVSRYDEKAKIPQQSFPSESSLSDAQGPPGPEGREASGGTFSPDSSAIPSFERPANTDGVHFTIGSVQREVLRIQGVPDEIRGQTWVYGLSEVVFKDGLVFRYNNFDGTLKVNLLPSNSPPSEPPSFFSLGSTTDEVLLVQGTPTRIEGNRWYYGFSEVRFSEGRVDNFENFFGNLKIRMAPADSGNADSARSFFTIGASYDDVLSAQGTPTSIRGNMWFYQLSNILFRNGKVQYVVNSSGNLRFIPPQEQTRKE